MKQAQTEQLFTNACRFGAQNLYKHFGYLASAALLGTVLTALVMLFMALFMVGLNFDQIKLMMTEIKTCCASYDTQLITAWMANGGWRIVSMIGGLLVAAFVLARYISLGMIAMALAIYDQRHLSFSLFFGAYRYLLSDCIATICYYCAVSIGLAFLVLPGIYLMLAFALYPQYIVDYNAGPFEALGKSFAMTKGYKLQILGIVIVISLVQTISAVLFSGLLSFLVFPFTALTMTYAYRELFMAYTRHEKTTSPV